jgi:hypothetical protein
VIELFELFGLSEEYVKDVLGAASSHHNAFESLKLRATMTYEAMSDADQSRLAEAHKRLSGMKITNIRRQSDEREIMIDNMLQLLSSQQGRQVMNRYINLLIDHGQKHPESDVHDFLAYLKQEVKPYD